MLFSRSAARRARTQARISRHVRLRLEALEDRLAPANFDVTDVPTLIATVDASNANNEADTINVAAGTYAFNAPDNFFYGPNALPVLGNGAVFTRSGSAPLRFFCVSGGFDGLAAGNLILNDLELQNGLAQGGDGGSGSDGGGGAGLGGAVFNLNGSVTIVNATLSGNVVSTGPEGANGSGNPGPNPDGTDLYNLAFGNHLDAATAVSATAALSNSILANATGGNDLAAFNVDGAGTNTSFVDATDHNLVMSQSAGGGATISGTPLSIADPNLGLLQNNGGLTPTLALLANSPAIDAGDNTTALDNGLTTDQRGAARIANGGISLTVDLGAFEVQPAPVVTAVNPNVGPTSGGIVVTISGSGFTGATSVAFGATPASFMVLSDGTINATLPPGAAGAVHVTVTTPSGTSAATAADLFTYVAPPAVAG